MATQFGTTLAINGHTCITGYIVVDETDGPKEIVSEDIEDCDGSLETRIVFRTHAKVGFNLIAKTGSTFSEFPEGAKCTVTGYTAYFVDSLTVTKSKSATRGVVQMTNLGF